MTKISIAGKIISVQPRIRLLRSFDQRQHNYSGYALLVADVADPGKPAAWVGVGPAAQTQEAGGYEGNGKPEKEGGDGVGRWLDGRAKIPMKNNRAAQT